MIKNLLIYLLLTLSIFLGIQWMILYSQGSKNPYQSVHRQQQVPESAPPLSPQKDEKVVLEPCMPVQVLRSTNSDNLRQTKRQGVSDASSPEQTTTLQSPEYNKGVVVNRWSIRPSLDPLIAELHLAPDGSTSLELTPDPSFVAFGRLREVGVWVDSNLPLDSASEQAFEHNNQDLDWTLSLYYQQDLFRISSTWIRLRAEVGYGPQDGVEAKVGLGAAIRF